jgi:hypothetical protein
MTGTGGHMKDEKNKLTYDEAAYILSYKKPHRLQRLCCAYYVNQTDDGGFFLECLVRWPIYTLFYLPAMIIEIAYCIYDGGLKEVGHWSRRIESYHIGKFDYASDRIKEVLCE